MVLQRAARSKDTTPVKQRPPAKAQPLCPPHALAKGFTMGRGRALSSPGKFPCMQPIGTAFERAAVWLRRCKLSAACFMCRLICTR